MQRGPEVYGQCMVHGDSFECTSQRKFLSARAQVAGDGVLLVRCHALAPVREWLIKIGCAHGQWEVFCVRISNERSFEKLSCMPERTLG